jgi:hypothetical protein
MFTLGRCGSNPRCVWKHGASGVCDPVAGRMTCGPWRGPVGAS